MSFNYIFPAKSWRRVWKSITRHSAGAIVIYHLPGYPFMTEGTILVCSGKRIVFYQISDDGGNVACTSPCVSSQFFPVYCENAIIVTNMKETFFCSDAQILFEDHFEIVFIPLVIHIP